MLKEVETRVSVGGGATRREAPVEVGVSSRRTPFACSGVRSRVHQGGPIGGVRAGQTPVRSGPNTHASKCTQIEHRRGRSGRHELGSEPLEAVRSHKSDHVPGAGSHGIVRRQRYARASPEPGAPPSRDAPPIVAKMPPEHRRSTAPTPTAADRAPHRSAGKPFVGELQVRDVVYKTIIVHMPVHVPGGMCAPPVRIEVPCMIVLR